MVPLKACMVLDIGFYVAVRCHRYSFHCTHWHDKTVSFPVEDSLTTKYKWGGCASKQTIEVELRISSCLSGAPRGDMCARVKSMYLICS